MVGGGGGGTERENANVVFSVLFEARSIAKSWALWDCHHPHDVKFNSCVAIVHLFMHCIYLTDWHQEFILVYFILKVSFTFLKIKPASYEKIKRRNPQAVLDPAMDEQPILFYTEQFNFLKSEDRKTIFKALLTMRMMDIKSWDYWQWGTNMIETFKSQRPRLNAKQVLQKNNSCSCKVVDTHTIILYGIWNNWHQGINMIEPLI